MQRHPEWRRAFQSGGKGARGGNSAPGPIAEPWPFPAARAWIREAGAVFGLSATVHQAGHNSCRRLRGPLCDRRQAASNCPCGSRQHPDTDANVQPRADIRQRPAQSMLLKPVDVRAQGVNSTCVVPDGALQAPYLMAPCARVTEVGVREALKIPYSGWEWFRAGDPGLPAWFTTATGEHHSGCIRNQRAAALPTSGQA